MPVTEKEGVGGVFTKHVDRDGLVVTTDGVFGTRKCCIKSALER